MAASLSPAVVHPQLTGITSSITLPPAGGDQAGHAEGDEAPTLLTQIASVSPSPLADLHSLLPVSRDFSDEAGFTALCNDLLVLNEREHRDPGRRSINIPGTKVTVSPFQFYHAFHLVSQRGRDLHGGILADEPGTGKTHIFFAACLIRALAFESARQVRLHWSGRGRRKLGRRAEQHLPEGANGRGCPSQKQGQMVCYCVPGSLTRTICDHTPGGVSAMYCSNETWPDVLRLVQSAALDPSVYQLSLVHNNAPARFTRPLRPLVKKLSSGAQPDLRGVSPASHIFITTASSPRLWNVFSEASLRAGLIIVDEAHQVLRARDSLMLRMASEFSGNGADVWFVTATPFSGCTLADWVAPMRLMAPGRAGAMQGLVAELDRARSSGDAVDALLFQGLFRRVFDEGLVLRHLGTSAFFGRAISDVQRVQPRVVSRDTPQQHRIAVQELASQVAYRDPRLQDPGSRGLLYLASLFPAAAQLMLDEPIALELAAVRDLVRQVKNRLRIEESEPLRRLADRVVRDSPKLDYILEELSRMDLDRSERDRAGARGSSKLAAGEDLQMKKMVIITPTAVSAVFLYLALIRHRKDVVLIHSWISSREKEQVVNNFRSLSAAKLVKHNRVLIAPMAAAGTGVNLQAASYQILTSPLPDRASQLQAFARTNRSGQRLRPLHHKILVLEDSPVDRLVLASQAGLEIESDPFNIYERLRIARHTPPAGAVSPDPAAEEPAPSSSRSSTLGVDEAVLFRDAASFPPASPAARGRQQRDEDTESSTMGVDEALLLQTALTFSPGGSTDDFSPGEIADNEDRDSPSGDGHSQSDTYSIFRDSSSEHTTAGQRDNSHGSPPTRPSDWTAEPLGGGQRGATTSSSSSSSGNRWNLTYTRAPPHPPRPGAQDAGPRPRPPVPAPRYRVEADEADLEIRASTDPGPPSSQAGPGRPGVGGGGGHAGGRGAGREEPGLVGSFLDVSEAWEIVLPKGK